MNFICLDVETANESAASICQIGLAFYADGVHRPELDVETLLDPEDYFLPQYTSIHGITEGHVSGSPTFKEVYPLLAETLATHSVLTHSPFDRVSLRQASAKYQLQELSPRWLDTLRVARRAWPERMYREGHRLGDLAEMCGVSFIHHSALQDAWCAGQVFLAACTKTSLTLEDWYNRVNHPVQGRVILEPTLEGHLSGERVVFTGRLTMTRSEAARLAADAGCDVDDGVTKHTTLVVVGVQDAMRLMGKEISSKHQKALDWIAKGKKVKIITEDDFHKLFQVSA